MNLFLRQTKQLSSALLFLFLLSSPKILSQSLVNAPVSDSLNFLFISDFGGQGGKIQREVGIQLGHEASIDKSSFVITGGDNYHQNGIATSTDPKWKTEFENIYSDSSLMIPWYASLGNHDYNGNPDAEIQYSQISKRWRLPARYYSHNAKLNDSTDLLFVHLDTSPFISDYRKNDSIYHVSGQDTKAQLRWLDSILAQSNACWKIVIGHHPIYSSVEKRGNTKELIEQVLPILDKYGVQVYFCGHEHFMEYLEDGAINSFICGSAALTRPASNRDDEKFGSDTPGFLSVTIKQNVLKVHYINSKGDNLYTAVVEHNGK